MSKIDESQLITFHEYVMGTVVTYTLTNEPNENNGAASALARARTIFRRIDAIFSTWRVDSPVSQFRRGELPLGDCPREVGEVVETCSSLREMTNGWFDPWAMPGGFDPTGYVKGWAAELACLEFERCELDGVIVNAAGDIATLGSMASNAPFRIGVVHPEDRHRLDFVVTSPGAVATSSTAERGAHLFDPRQDAFRTQSSSATITGPSLGVADALATALAVAGPEGFSFVERAGYEGLVRTLDGRREMTARFPLAE